jgi:Peptidase family S41/PDZ domain
MNNFKFVAILLCTAPLGLAQLTADQKVIDFMELAGLYAKNYAPYEWKRDVMHFDAYNIKPWLEKVNAAKTDLEFYDICVNYVASLQDSHDEFTLPSDFFAYLHLDTDIYDGKTLIDGIDRSYLPSSKFPFQIGDEIVSVDGKGTQDWIQANIPYAANGSGNPSSRRRLAADAITFREQFFFPRAHEIGDSATVVVLRQNGNMETYTIPWDKSGTPIIKVGPVESPKSAAREMQKPPSVTRARVLSTSASHAVGNELSHLRVAPIPADEFQPEEQPVNPWGVYTGTPDPPIQDAIPSYMQPLADLQSMSALQTPFDSFGGFGNPSPVFNPPAGFKLRLGSKSTDQFLSGTFPSGSKTVGFIRIATMSPSNTNNALSQFATEMAFFQQNTDGLVIDVMRNGGGSLCYTEALAKNLIPGPFRSIAYEIRATQFWVEAFSSTLFNAKATGAPQWVINLYTSYLAQVKQALSENRGLTGDVPICGPTFDVSGLTDQQGNNIAFTKPILVLTDEFTLSAAEAFAMILQDANRSKTLGTRTDGGGGNPAGYNAGVYSEGQTRVTRTFITRKNLVSTPDFPQSRFLENTGVYPDIVQDYMTKDNLLNGGKNFLTAILQTLQNML